MERPGPIALFGSGETSPSGRKAHAYLFNMLPKPVRVAILETPAGFQPNSALVAGKIKEFIEERLPGYQPQVEVIKARAKGDLFDPNNPALVDSLLEASYIFAGPGSPTYAARHLRGTRALLNMVERNREGAIIALASAAATASGKFVLPVYEIYKAGHDLHWEQGLDLFAAHGFNLTVVTHWNNQEGGAELDTTRSYMGEARFKRLRAMLPLDTVILGVDEHTCCVLDFAAKRCSMMGLGSVTVLAGDTKRTYRSGESFPLAELLMR